MEANYMFEMLPEGEAGEAEMDIEEEGSIREELGHTEGRVGPELYETLVGKASHVQENFIFTNGVSKGCDSLSSTEAVNNGSFTTKDHASPTNYRRGVKPAWSDDKVQPSVHVAYSSLTRESKQKLEELMQQWSAWHAQHISSLQSSIQVLESGEQIFFPALHVGEKKQSQVMFWMDHQPGKVQGNGQIVLENDVPLYDRDYGLGLTLVDGSNNVEGGQKIIGDTRRCFNCGGYSHSLNDCPRPRNNVAVTNARNIHMSKRNQSSASRSSTRYYESSSAGKFKGLKPGSLDAETRKLLGLGELDPPPWLARMRELGYPPGYLVAEDDDEDEEPGITIFADGDSNTQDHPEEEKNKSMGEENPKPPQARVKKAVEFPGISGDGDSPSSTLSDLIRQHGSHHHTHRPTHQQQQKEAVLVGGGSRSYSITTYNNKHYRVSCNSGASRELEENPPPPGTTESLLFHSPSPIQRRNFSSSSIGFGGGGGYPRPPFEDALVLQHRRRNHDPQLLPHSYPPWNSSSMGGFWGGGGYDDHVSRRWDDDNALFRVEELDRLPFVETRPEILHPNYMPHF